MRSLSTTARTAISGEQTPEVFLALVTINHDTFSEPLRFVNNNEDVTTNDGTYTAYPFNIELPALGEESLPNITLKIDNVDLRISEAVKNLQSAPSVSISVVLASSPNTVEAGPFECILRNVNVPLVGGLVEATLNFEDLLNEPFPADSFKPSSHPGLFK